MVESGLTYGFFDAETYVLASVGLDARRSGTLISQTHASEGGVATYSIVDSQSSAGHFGNQAARHS